MSRAGSGIGIGSISYHPRGFIHGPQPGSYEASLPKDRAEETAVMIDTFAPLLVSRPSDDDLHVLDELHEQSVRSQMEDLNRTREASRRQEEELKLCREDLLSLKEKVGMNI